MTDYTIHVFSPEGNPRWEFSRDIDPLPVENYYPRVIGQTRGFSTYDIFSSDGKFLFKAKIELHTTPGLIFKNGYIYTLAVDEAGFRRAVRLKMLEKKKDKDILF